ncbi:hypothetical protein B0H14DRAFT_2596704 [Mycena olivaceomarginata]|nr:hypothetical protein B0H14DRAFT_2596704 [Mycena olivaceomarginata]
MHGSLQGKPDETLDWTGSLMIDVRVGRSLETGGVTAVVDTHTGRRTGEDLDLPCKRRWNRHKKTVMGISPRMKEGGEGGAVLSVRTHTECEGQGTYPSPLSMVGAARSLRMAQSRFSGREADGPTANGAKAGRQGQLSRCPGGEGGTGGDIKETGYRRSGIDQLGKCMREEGGVRWLRKDRAASVGYMRQQMEACVSVRGRASELKRGASGEETIKTVISLGKVHIKTATHGGAQCITESRVETGRRGHQGIYGGRPSRRRKVGLAAAALESRGRGGPRREEAGYMRVYHEMLEKPRPHQLELAMGDRRTHTISSKVSIGIWEHSPRREREPGREGGGGGRRVVSQANTKAGSGVGS